MKKFLVFMILALGFAVCYAAPPPPPDVGPLTEIVMPDCEAMPVMVQEITCYLQPAPLLFELNLVGNEFIRPPGYAEMRILFNDQYEGMQIRPPNMEVPGLVNTQRGFEIVPSHNSSGGMPG